jgi:hypothetical protein
MSRAQLISKLLKVDPQLAIRVLRNDRITGRLKAAALIKELDLKTSAYDNPY